MNDDELERERRKQRRLEKLGSNDPHCGLCGEDHWQTLDLHHVAGRRHDEALVTVCSNCHRRVTDDQKDYPPFEAESDPAMASIGHFLLGLADMLRIVVPKLRQFGLSLIQRASGTEGASS